MNNKTGVLHPARTQKSNADRWFFWIAVLMILSSIGLSLLTLQGLHQNYAPDELMRFDISEFIYKNNHLPWGDEPELLTVWGFNYSFTPYLPNILAVLPMKLVGLFTDSYWLRYMAFRLVGTASITALGIFVYHTAKRLFASLGSRILYLSLCLFLPQIIFLSGYFNNDLPSVAICSGILLCWTIALQDGWSWKVCIGYGVLMGMLTVTYYFAYPYILAGILFFVFTCWKESRQKKVFWQKIAAIIAIAFGIGGWFFIKNALFYPWDFLGFKATDLYADLYMVDSIKPEPGDFGPGVAPSEVMSFMEMLTMEPLGVNWIKAALFSFLGFFGAFHFRMDIQAYRFYTAFLFPALLLGIVLALRNWKRKSSAERWYCIALLIALILPFLLTLVYSYYGDYQPQGRYFISCLPAFACFVAFGWQKLQTWLNQLWRWIKDRLHLAHPVHLPLCAAAGILYWILGPYLYLSIMRPVLLQQTELWMKALGWM